MEQSAYLKVSKKIRNPNLDIIRCIATLCVISVHFFLNTDFYSLPINGERMIFMTGMRTSFMVCVPLFMMLTGYLMNQKELSLKYYKGILHTLGIYVVISLLCLFYKHFYMGEPLTVAYVISQILKFSADPYAWYIKMYIGLFLLIPFLNLIYKGLKSKSEKNILITTLFVLTILPSIFKSLKFDSISSWWINIYPLTYYFIGCYLKEFQPKISKLWNCILLFGAYFISTASNVYLSNGEKFKKGDFNNWPGWQCLICAVLLFILINNLNLSKMPVFLNKIIQWISKLSLGIYLSSWILDQIVYPQLKAIEPVMIYQLKYFPLAVLAVFIGALIISYAADLIVNLIIFLAKKAFKPVNRNKS